MTSVAPIVLFVYNRPWHTCQTIEALQKNALAVDSDLIIFSDAPKSEVHADAVSKVRAYIRQVKGFKSITIIEREENVGLARNIIEGVTEVCNRYGRVIVLEDDIVTSPHFLTFMNAALDRYADEPRVWHISGWNYPIETDGMEDDAFLWQMMNCWGWATWTDCWKHFSKDPERLVQTWDESQIKRFNLDGAYDFWAHVHANINGQLNTWAIFWYASIFENDGLALNPVHAYVLNIGHDGSGENCGSTNGFMSTINERMIEIFPAKIEEDQAAREKIKNFYIKSNQSIFKRLSNRVGRLIRSFNLCL